MAASDESEFLLSMDGDGSGQRVIGRKARPKQLNLERQNATVARVIAKTQYDK